MASLALSLPLRYRLFLAIGVFFVGFFLAAGFIYRLTDGSPLAWVALAFAVAGLGAIVSAGVILVFRTISRSPFE